MTGSTEVMGNGGEEKAGGVATEKKIELRAANVRCTTCVANYYKRRIRLLYSNDNETTERKTVRKKVRKKESKDRKKERKRERKKERKTVELPCAGEGLRCVNISQKALEHRRR